MDTFFVDIKNLNKRNVEEIGQAINNEDWDEAEYSARSLLGSIAATKILKKRFSNKKEK